MHRRARRASSPASRRLVLEQLESRQLLAADLVPRHNFFDPEDVNDDGSHTPQDALIVINNLNGGLDTDGHFVDVNADGQRTPHDALRVINRLNRDRNQEPRDDVHRDITPRAPAAVRSFDGTGNNLDHPEYGSTGEQLLRAAPADYADGISSPAGEDRPSPRAISNELADHGEAELPNERKTSAFLFVWGQFLDHDLDLTTPVENGEVFPIPVPEGDPSFDPDNTGTQVIPLTRSQFDPATGTDASNPRQQINSITAWIDGSMVYGSDDATAASLRELAGGRLKTSGDGLLPADENGSFLAGDIRANENIQLTAMHTLFVREHNYWADRIAAERPGLGDEQIFQQARAIVIAEIQAITYNEFLPALLGQRAFKHYSGYDPTVNPGIVNEFSTAAFRFGHTTLRDKIEFFGNNGRAIRDAVGLREAFFNPDLLRETGIDSLLKFVASVQSEEVDLLVVDSVRNFLFGMPGQGGLDLVSLNIQRGRDHGLADYNSVRVAYGLLPADGFDDITTDTVVQEKLAALYGSVDNVDLWVAGLAEDHVPGSSLGPTFQRIIADQFQRLRDGDRFWYQNLFQGADLKRLERTTLADILRRNTDVSNLQDNLFFFRAAAQGSVFVDANGNGRFDPRERGLSGVAVELRDDQGTVLVVTRTDRHGQYRFDDFTSTGDYRVHVAAAPEQGIPEDVALDLLISRGGERLRHLDLAVDLLDQLATDVAASGSTRSRRA